MPGGSLCLSGSYVFDKDESNNLSGPALKINCSDSRTLNRVVYAVRKHVVVGCMDNQQKVFPRRGSDVFACRAAIRPSNSFFEASMTMLHDKSLYQAIKSLLKVEQ